MGRSKTKAVTIELRDSSEIAKDIVVGLTDGTGEVLSALKDNLVARAELSTKSILATTSTEVENDVLKAKMKNLLLKKELKELKDANNITTPIVL